MCFQWADLQGKQAGGWMQEQGSEALGAEGWRAEGEIMKFHCNLDPLHFKGWLFLSYISQ